MHNAILHTGFGFYFVMLNYQSLLSWKDQTFIEHLKSGGKRYTKVSEKGIRKKKTTDVVRKKCRKIYQWHSAVIFTKDPYICL